MRERTILASDLDNSHVMSIDGKVKLPITRHVDDAETVALSCDYIDTGPIDLWSALEHDKRNRRQR